MVRSFGLAPSHNYHYTVKGMNTQRPRMTHGQFERYQELKQGHNILVIGDLHAPFIKDGYLEHNLMLYDKYHVDQVIFIGDIIDNHYSSYHETDPDGYSAGEELDRAIDKLKPWVEAFPEASVTIGNHDRLVHRKAFSSGVSKKWIKTYSEVLEAPGWDFVDHLFIDDVLYVHGDGAGHASPRSKKDLCSTVQGHFHSRCYVEWHVGRNYRIFSAQVGCGINQNAYSMAYGKNGPKMAISSLLVLNDGQLPVIEPMKL